MKPTQSYKHFNHYHEITENHEIVNFGEGEFIANKIALPVLKALNELGLKTRTHNIDSEGGFLSIILSDNIKFEVRIVKETDRVIYNGQTELLISFTHKSKIMSATNAPLDEQGEFEKATTSAIEYLKNKNVSRQTIIITAEGAELLQGDFYHSFPGIQPKSLTEEV